MNVRSYVENRDGCLRERQVKQQLYFQPKAAEYVTKSDLKTWAQTWNQQKTKKLTFSPYSETALLAVVFHLDFKNPL